jgi:cytochrome P450
MSVQPVLHAPAVSDEEPDALIAQFEENPYPFYEAMRAAGPVMQDPMLGIFHVTGRAEIEAVLKDYATFSAAANSAVVGPFLGDGFASIDGKAHVRLRSLVSMAFTPAAIEAWQERLVGPTVREILAPFQGRPSMELVEHFADRLPLTVIARMLDVPIAEFEVLRGWYHALCTAMLEFPRVTPNREKGLAASQAIIDFLRPIVRERMARPTADNLIGHLAMVELLGEKLTEAEILIFARGLLFGGAETARHMLANTLWGVLAGGANERIRTEPRAVEGAVEEGLRFLGSGAYRLATEDVTIGGVAIPKGSFVHCAIAAHHFDPAYFPDPERFDIDRFPDHMAFGGGRHYCLGAHLARAEGRLGVKAFFDAFPRARLDPDRPVVFRGTGLRSPVELHVLLD